jgi:hypothetical protein
MPKTTNDNRSSPSTFRLGDDITAAMERLHIRDGISLSEQARRALVPWLQKKGVLKAGTRTSRKG